MTEETNDIAILEKISLEFLKILKSEAKARGDNDFIGNASLIWDTTKIAIMVYRELEQWERKVNE